jgi:phosphate transport system protein
MQDTAICSLPALHPAHTWEKVNSASMSSRAAGPPAHTSRDFETELRELRAQALAMGARCERTVMVALEAFRRGDAQALADVQTLDAQVDRDEMEIHALVLRILALRQPVADDLRFLAAALRLITDLERIGDEAVNIAERALDPNGHAKSLVHQELESMAAEAQGMLQGALRAFVERDPDGAERVLLCDDVVDGYCGAIIAKMTHYIATHSGDVPAGLRVVRVAKYLERIADHATNVAEEVIFMVRGDDVRHRKRV